MGKTVNLALSKEGPGFYTRFELLPRSNLTTALLPRLRFTSPPTDAGPLHRQLLLPDVI